MIVAIDGKKAELQQARVQKRSNLGGTTPTYHFLKLYFKEYPFQPLGLDEVPRPRFARALESIFVGLVSTRRH